MCTLVASKEGNCITFDEMLAGHSSNRTAWGWANATEFHRSLIAPTKKEYDEYVEKCKGVPHIVHFRLASHGVNSIDNTHPFKLTNGGYMAHNGIFGGLNHATMSDTAMTVPFVNFLMTQSPEVRRTFMDDGITTELRKDPLYEEAFQEYDKLSQDLKSAFAKGLAKGNWSKVAIISPQFGLEIYNEQSTSAVMDAETNIWYSNNGCKRWNTYSTDPRKTNVYSNYQTRGSNRQSESCALPARYNSSRGVRSVSWNGDGYDYID